LGGIGFFEFGGVSEPDGMDGAYGGNGIFEPPVE